MSIINQKGTSLFLQTLSIILLLAFFCAVIIQINRDSDSGINRQSDRPINLEPYRPNK